MKDDKSSHLSESNEEVNNWVKLMGDDIVLREIVPGFGPISEVGDVVRCSYDCYTVDNKSNERLVKVESACDICFKIGEQDCIPGLELALRHARKGGEFVVKCSSKFGYGYIGRPAYGNFLAIPADTNLEFDVRDVSQVDFSSLSVGQRTNEEIKLRKDAGNRWFSAKDYPRAGRAYSKGIQTAEGLLNAQSPEDLNTSDSKETQELYLACLNNLAAVYLSTSENLKAKETCIRVLEIQPSNVKAILRAAKSALALDEYEECEACLSKLKDLDPTNAEAEKEWVRLRKAKKKYRDDSQRMAQRMSKKLFDTSSDETNTSPTITSASQASLDPELEEIKHEPISTTSTPLHTEKVSQEHDSNSSNQNGQVKAEVNKVQLGKQKATSHGRNTVMFLLTSLFVVIASAFVAYLLTQQP